MKKLIYILAFILFNLSLNAQIKLQNSELAFCIIASDTVKAKEFYGECLGLKATGSQTISGMKMLLFGSGQSTVKIRVYTQDKPKRDTEILASNGFRFATIPVNNFDSVIIRINDRKFENPIIKNENNVRTAIAKDSDGNVIELVDLKTQPQRKVELGLLTLNLDSADYFYKTILGFEEAHQISGPKPIDNAIEKRYKANNTIIRVFSPEGVRPTYNEIFSAFKGYRYITFTLTQDVDLLYQKFLGLGYNFASKLAPYGSSAYLFMVYGPGGAIHEFLGPKHVEEPNTAFSDLKFTADYYAPGLPPQDDISGTLEANALVIHNGKIYCSTTYAGPNGTPAESDPKILVKESASGKWKIDYMGGSKFIRFPIIRSINFTSDAKGKDLPEPVPVLVAGTGAWRSWNPDGVYVISRNDNTNKWVLSKLSEQCWNIANANHGCEVRAIFDHRDKVTGVHYVFAGAYNGAVYRGWYNPSKPGLVEWDPNPEIDSLIGHVLCSTELNDTLYVGMSFGEGSGEPGKWRPYKDYGVWKRIDGVRKPVVGHNYDTTEKLQWEWIKVEEWQKQDKPEEHNRMGQFRGLSTITDPNDNSNKLLAFHWDSPDSFIETLDPKNGYKSNIELKTKEFVQKLWNNQAAGFVTAGYNDWAEAIHPETKEKVHLIGAWAMYPGGETATPEGKSSWFFVRYKDASYRLVRIWDENNPLTGATNGLKGCRSIIPSPFPEDSSKVWYFCGFDLTGQGTTSVAGRKAWIYKGSLLENPTSITDNNTLDNLIITPNPASEYIEITPSLQEGAGGVQIIKVFNTFGEMVMTEKIHPMTSSHRMNIEHLPVGLYFIQIGDYSEKFMVVR